MKFLNILGFILGNQISVNSEFNSYNAGTSSEKKSVASLTNNSISLQKIVYKKQEENNETSTIKNEEKRIVRIKSMKL